MITKKNGEPFATEMAAKSRKGIENKKNGTDTKVVKVDGGWALEEQSTKKKPDSKTEPRRKTRVPIGSRRVLQYPEIPGYATRVVTDRDDGRLQNFKNAYWEHVLDSEMDGDDQGAQDTSKMGDTVGKPVGGGRMGYLMKLKDKYRQEDLAAKKAMVDETEEGLRMKKNEAPEGQYGSVSIEKGV